MFVGTTAEALVDGVSTVTRGAIKGRFFHFYPKRDVDLLKWLGHWMKKGWFYFKHIYYTFIEKQILIQLILIPRYSERLVWQVFIFIPLLLSVGRSVCLYKLNMKTLHFPLSPKVIELPDPYLV